MADERFSVGDSKKRDTDASPWPMVRFVRMWGGAVVRRGFGVEWRLWIALMIAVMWGEGVPAQDWVSYRLTDWPPPNTATRECGAVADTFGNIHVYLSTAFEQQYDRLHYLRANFYGQVLTDTALIDTTTLIGAHPSSMTVVGNDENAWCVWANFVSNDPPFTSTFMAERGAIGQEQMPMTLLGYGGVVGGPDWNTDAALRRSDNTIHMVNYRHYFRFTTLGDTLVWRKRLDGVPINTVGPKIALAPDGTPWMAALNDLGNLNAEVLLIRFGQDTSQTVYHPFAGQDVHWLIYGFEIDRNYQFHFMLNTDTARVAYARMDTTFQLLEWRVLERPYDSHASMGMDSTGNNLFVWDDGMQMQWAARRADGTWPHPSAVIGPSIDGMSFSVVALDSEWFAFTGQFAWDTDRANVGLFTYGTPPNALSPIHPHTTLLPISVYPNPFSGQFQLDISTPGASAVALYDILGRQVWLAPLTLNMTRWIVADPQLSMLPSGSYFLHIQGTQPSAPIQIIHLK